MATEFQPPKALPKKENSPSVFLAGSIDQGTAVNWQAQIVESLGGVECCIFNPRRLEWNASLPQTKETPEFRGQVEWELSGLELADIIVVYFAPDSKSPITLLELGLFADSGKLLVCCPDGFYRKGNVDIVCERFEIETFPYLDDLTRKLIQRLGG